MSCEKRVAYLDRRLSDAERISFEAHLARCPHCQAEVGHWQEISEGLRELVEQQTRDAMDVPLVSAQQLHRRATKRFVRESSPMRWLAWALVPAMSAAAVVFYLRPSVTPTVPEPIQPPAQVAKVEPTDNRRHLTYGRDTIDLEPDAVLKVVEAGEARTVVSLRSGTADFSVDSSQGKRDFHVRASDFADVRVTGTKFTVHAEADAVDVTVREGTVIVTPDGGEEVVVPAGQSAHAVRPVPPKPLDVAPPKEKPQLSHASAKAAAAAPKREASYDAWTSAAAKGECASIIAAMSARVAFAPGDTRTWSLLGDCQRKTKQWADAVTSYEHVITSADTNAQRARYFAAEIELDALDRPKAAVRHLRDYLAASKQSEALDRAARLRLARAHIQAGDRAAARKVIADLSSLYPASREAKDASELLDAIGP
jgi:ferric-dicitrate binding protein FerR (iron transport regulator)